MFRISVLILGLLVSASVGVLSASAATVALTGTHMAATAGSNRPAVTHFPRNTSTVYFDYTVVTPSAADNGRVEAFAGAPGGRLVASAQLFFGAAASFDAPLRPAHGTWPDGSYCSVLYVDGTARTLNGVMPIGWSVGKSTSPGCKLSSLHLQLTGALHIGRRSSLEVVVRGPHHPIHGALVQLNGSAVGISTAYQGKTNQQGSYTFHGLEPVHQGAVVITASKVNFRTVKKTVDLRS